jgi:hypothetical protein
VFFDLRELEDDREFARGGDDDGLGGGIEFEIGFLNPVRPEFAEAVDERSRGPGSGFTGMDFAEDEAVWSVRFVEDFAAVVKKADDDCGCGIGLERLPSQRENGLFLAGASSQEGKAEQCKRKTHRQEAGSSMS